ncbi:hypothetical protein PF010_g20808 [Phytophthora fragariae]|uniref:Uncharacterized protein n=1 Tax=Phytophthora fragariae TaxID=53985 RepID=A0A6G0KD58_9STRA|nr:hypothetical protein PF010_g20808 [Phytophthora fragariae]
MGSGARRRRACFGPGTWNSPRHPAANDDGENLDAEMADGAAEENPPPRHAVTDNGAEADDAAKEKDASFAFIADEGEANAAQKVYGEMSDDAEEMRDESSLVEGPLVRLKTRRGTQVGRRTLVTSRQELLPRILSRILSRIPIRIPIRSETVTQEVE